MDFFHVFKFSQEQTFFFSLILHVLCFCCFRTISHLFSRPSPSNTRMLDIQYGSSISRSSKRIFSRAFVIYCDLSEMFVFRPHAPSEKKATAWRLREKGAKGNQNLEKKNLRVVLK